MPSAIENIANNTTACYLALVILVLTSFYYFIQSRKLPPGPVGIPFIGYWPFFDTSSIHHQLQELGTKYGEVFSFTVFGHLYVSLCSINAVREAVVKKSQDFEIRPEGFTLLNYYFQGAFAFTNGEEWKVLRKYHVQQMKELGMTTFKESSNGPIYDALGDCVKDLDKANGKPLDITHIILKGCNKILRTTLFSGEEDITDEILSDVCHSYSFMLEDMTGPNLLLVGPFAKYFIHPFTSGSRRGLHHHKIMMEILYKMIKKRKSTFNPNNVRNDILDRYFKEKSERVSHKDPSAQYFTDRALMGAIFQYIGDGVLTVAFFVAAIFKSLLDHPEEQDKIYNELLEVVGTSRDPAMEDKSRLPYTNAFILEVVRTCEVFPFIPEVQCTRETTIQGHRIPVGTIILTNTWATHYDPKEYDNPKKFDPSRYIANKGKKKAEAPILFGIGKRSCIGEGFAMAQAFLFLTYVVKHFRLSKAPSPDKQMPFFIGKLEVCANPRSHK